MESYITARHSPAKTRRVDLNAADKMGGTREGRGVKQTNIAGPFDQKRKLLIT